MSCSSGLPYSVRGEVGREVGELPLSTPIVFGLGLPERTLVQDIPVIRGK